MDGSHRFGRKVIRAVILAAVCLITGCAGPSTRVLPREHKEQTEPVEELPVLEEANPFYMQEELEILAASPRPAGSDGERNAVHYIRQLLEDYGYEVTLQGFTYQGEPEEEKISGTNVAAVRHAPSEEADILLIGARHDTGMWTPGAGSGASGVAALLETARLLSRMPTDTELRIVSFSCHEKEDAGIRYYMESLSEEERHRMIGAIWLDSIGSGRDSSIVLGTEDGNPTLLGDSVREACQELTEENWPYERQRNRVCRRFVQERLPVVFVGQKHEAYEADSRFDVPGIIDFEYLARTVNVVSRAVSDIMSPDTPSMMAKSHHYNDLRDDSYVQDTDSPIPFGETPFQTEMRLGMAGFLSAENTDNENNQIRSYRYPVKWFDVDQILITDYYYVENALSFIRIEGDGAGVDVADMQERLASVYGDPEEQNEGPGGIEQVWRDPVSRAEIRLSPEKDGYNLELKEYQTDPILIGGYEIIPASAPNPQMGLGARRIPESGEDGLKAQDSRENGLLVLIRRFLPLRDQANLIRVDFYTDGIGGTSVNLETVSAGTENMEGQEGGEKPAFVWGIDLEDALTKDGKWRNETNTVKQLLLLYGQMLEQTEPYRTAFAEAFPDGDGTEERILTGVKPGDLVEPLPDFKESFMWFVLTDRTEEAAGEWGVRIQFFYQYEELTAYRTLIRNNLKIDGK